MKDAKTYTSQVLEILPNGDAVLELPPEMCEELGWKEGDTLDISTEENGSIVLKKIEKGTNNVSIT